jgi:hypothetical protein
MRSHTAKYNNGNIEFCETLIAFLSRTCSKTVGFVTSHGDVEVGEEGFMTMMFKLGKTYPPDDALANEWISEGEIHNMDRRDSIRKHYEQKVRAIWTRPPKREGRGKMDNNSVHTPFWVKGSPSHGIIMTRDVVCLFNEL